MSENAIQYKIIKKGNGKFYPRMVTSIFNGWFGKPDEFDTMEEALDALKKYRLEREEKTRLNKEEVVFELK